MPNTEIAERIKNAIKQAGGYEEISRKTGLNARTLTRITSAETDPKLNNFIAISEATGVSVYYLIYGDKELEQMGETLAAMPSVVVRAYLTQQKQTEQIIQERLSKLETLVSRLDLDDLENIEES